MDDIDSVPQSSFTQTYFRLDKILNSRKDKCLKQYNQQMKPEDAEVTSTIQFVMAILSSLCIALSLILNFQSNLKTIIKAKYTIMILTIVHIVSIVMETRCRLNWMKQKKAIFFAWKQYIFAVIQIIFLLAFPNFWSIGQVFFFNYQTQSYSPIQIDSLLSICLLLRTAYILKFLVHSESYYGSRPDRLSRYYAVEISNFNAVRFLINEKPFRSIFTMSVLSMLMLPLAMNILQGPINSVFENYYSCLYYFIISQSTVGYGDMYPVTILGRLVSMLMIIVGLFFTSLILIFVVQQLKLTPNEQDTHYLLGRLETQNNMKKSIVKRIKQGYNVRKGHFQPDERKSKLQQLAILRLQNRKMIYTSITSQPANMRRMIMKNFSQLHHLVKQFSDRHQFLNEFCSVLMQKTPNRKRFNLRKQTNVNHLYQLLMKKQQNSESQDSK